MKGSQTSASRLCLLGFILLMTALALNGCSTTLGQGLMGGVAEGNEVRVRNPNDFSVRVSVRSDRQNREFTVAARGVASTAVPDGRYDIYFVYSNEPDALYQGDSFTLSNNGVEIQIVKVVDGNYGIRRVK